MKKYGGSTSFILVTSDLPEQLLALSKRIESRGYDARRWFKGVALPAVLMAHREHFRSQGAYGGVGAKWAIPYSQKYEQRKEKIAKTMDKEIFFRGLKKSLTRVTSDTIVEIEPQSFEFGTAVEEDRPKGGQPPNHFGYSIIQQEGARTVLGSRVSRKRKKGTQSRSGHRRPSEKKMKWKRRIPARPPVLMSWPRKLRGDLGGSFLKYLVLGSIEKVSVP